MKPLVDNASVSIDFPDKVYMGSFSRESGFDVSADAEEVLLKLVRPGEERREVSVHLHYYLLADILRATAEALADAPPLDDSHKESLREATASLSAALDGGKPKRKAKSKKQ
jgi:hypothetical protein